MKVPRYELKAEKSLMVFEFVNEGPKGEIGLIFFLRSHEYYCLIKIASLGSSLCQITFGELFSAQQNRFARFLSSFGMTGSFNEGGGGRGAAIAAPLPPIPHYANCYFEQSEKPSEAFLPKVIIFK